MHSVRSWSVLSLVFASGSDFFESGLYGFLTFPCCLWARDIVGGGLSLDCCGGWTGTGRRPSGGRSARRSPRVVLLMGS